MFWVLGKHPNHCYEYSYSETSFSLSVTSLPSWYQNLPSVSETFQLTRTMIEVLNTDSSSHCPKKSWTWNTINIFKTQRTVSTQGVFAHSPHFYMFFTYRISEQILFDFSFYISINMEKRVDSLFKFLIKYKFGLPFIMSLKFSNCKHNLSWKKTAGNVAEYSWKSFLSYYSSVAFHGSFWF